MTRLVTHSLNICHALLCQQGIVYPTRGIRTGLANLAAVGPNIPVKIVIVICIQAHKKIYYGIMHVTILLKHLHYNKLNIISKNKATNLIEAAILF